MRRFFCCCFLLLVAIFSPSLINAVEYEDFKDFKYSVLPFTFFPYFYYSLDEFLMGFYIDIPLSKETNASVSFGGNFTQTYQHGRSSLVIPAKDARHPGIAASFFFGTDKRKYFTDLQDENFFIVRGKNFEGEISALGSYFNGKLKTRLSGGYRSADVYSIDIQIPSSDPYFLNFQSGSMNEIYGFHQFLFYSLGGKFVFTKTNEMFVSEKSLMLKALGGWTDFSSFSQAFQAEVKIQQAIYKEFLRVDFSLDAYFQTHNTLFLTQTPATIGITILNPLSPFKRVAGQALALEWAFWQLPFGFLTLYADFQAAIFTQTAINELSVAYGFSVGGCFYQPKATIPSGYASFSYNIETRKFYVYAGVGLAL